MRERLRKLKLVITVFSVLIAICLVTLGCVLIFGDDGSAVRTATLQDNIIGITIEK